MPDLGVQLGKRKLEQWHDETSQLPSFLSPVAKAADGPAQAPGKLDDDHLSLGPSHLPTPPVTADALADDEALSVARATALAAPPPSLLSPAFTPPATPGTATPAQEPRGIPVDSTIPQGGCGTKRPRLLEKLPEVQCVVRARIPMTSGTEMFLHLYKNNVDSKEHLAIVFGGHIRSKSLDAPRPGETEMDRMIRGAYTGRLFPGRTTSGMLSEARGEIGQGGTKLPGPALVRIHSECYTGETAWSARCDCGEQLDEAARLMTLPGNDNGGVIIYLRQEGRGIGLGEKLKAYNLQDLGSDTVEANLLLRHPADARSYGLATAMLMDLDQTEIRLLTNNPDKIRAVEGPGREVIVKERVAMVPLSWRGKGGFKSKEVDGYLKTKVCFFISDARTVQCYRTNTACSSDRKDGPHAPDGFRIIMKASSIVTFDDLALEQSKRAVETTDKGQNQGVWRFAEGSGPWLKTHRSPQAPCT